MNLTNKQIAKELYNNCMEEHNPGDKLLATIIKFVSEEWKDEEKFADILSEVTELSTTNEFYHKDEFFDLIDDYVEYYFEEYSKDNDCIINYALQVEEVITERYDSAFALFIATSIIVVVEEINQEEENDLINFCSPLKGLELSETDIKTSKAEEVWKPKFKFEEGGITQEQHEFNLDQIRIMIEDLQDSKMAIKYVTNVIEILKEKFSVEFAYKYFKMIQGYAELQSNKYKNGGNK